MGRWLVLSLFLSACAPEPRTTVGVDTRVAVTITPADDKVPFDPHGARILAASQDLARAAGHSIQLDLDAAIVPEFRAAFEDAVAKAFENMTLDLTDLRRRSPEVFAHGAPLVERVVLRYDASRSSDQVALDPASRTVSILGPATRKELVARGLLAEILRIHHADHLNLRFAGKEPDAVPKGERRDYFVYLTRHQERRAKRAEPDSLAESPNAVRILRVLRLLELEPSDAKLGSDARRWLLGEMSWVVSRYFQDARTVRAVPANSAFRRAEGALGRWLVGAYSSSSEEDRRAIEKAMFDHAAAWPAVDRFAFGLRIIDASRKAPDNFYRYALESEGGLKRLVQALRERNDPILAQTVFQNLGRAGGSLGVRLNVLRGLEDKPALWRAAMRVFADEPPRDVLVLEEAQRIWLQRPEYRGLLLYLLGRIDEYDRGDVDWRGFENAFGARVSETELDALLAEGTRAMVALPIIWPALAKGYARSPHIIPKLDAFLADSEIWKNRRNDAYGVMTRITSRLCAEKTPSDLSAFHDYFLRRVASHPGEPYGQVADEATSERCKPPPPPPPPRNEVRLISAKQRRIRIDQSKGEEI